MRKLLFSSRKNDTAPRKALRGDAYTRLFRGAAVERAWWKSLRPSGQHVVRAAALGGLRPGWVLTKLSAAAVLGAQIKTCPSEITCAAAPGKGRAFTELPGVRAGLLPPHAKVVRQAVAVEAGAEVAVLCTSPACTMFDVAASCPLDESLVVINSLLAKASADAARSEALKKEADMLKGLHPIVDASKLARQESFDYLRMSAAEVEAEAGRLMRENGRALRAGGRQFCRQGARRDELAAGTAAALLGAKSFRAFRSQVDRYRQHGLNTKTAAGLYEECLALVWKNRRRFGVRRALLALLFATDQCESAAESLSCARFFELGFSQPTLQVEFLAADSGRAVYRVDGAWDLRETPRGKARGPFPDAVVLGAPAPPASKQALLFEFDGAAKYRDPEMLRGRDRGDVLAAQIRREADLREKGYEIVRVIWGDLNPPAGLARKLSRFDIPRLRLRKRKR
ncbi:MAG: hypothetical protein LBR44_05200 [Clostridiales Family XIII bacterium]|jgi:hypothetical protein|nr:hypothetical protein [Clostridiales Family XIII bacterium]